MRRSRTRPRGGEARRRRCDIASMDFTVCFVLFWPFVNISLDLPNLWCNRSDQVFAPSLTGLFLGFTELIFWPTLFALMCIFASLRCDVIETADEATLDAT